MTKERLTSELAGIILQHVRNPKGRLTEISDLCGINRKYFTRKGMARMRFHQMVRLFYALALIGERWEYEEMMAEFNALLAEWAEAFEYELFDNV